MSEAATWDPIEPPTREVPDKKPKSQVPWVTRIISTFFNPSAWTIFFAIVMALVVGALIVVFFDPKVQETMGYLFARPGDFFSEAGRAFSGFFIALVRGSLFDWTQPTFAGAFKPLTETMVRATPLIIAGLAIAVAFTGGLFNIGVQGQVIFGAIFGGFVGFTFDLPPVIHLLLAVLGAIVGGAIWGLIPGFLRAQLGANEVIVTIMMNSIAALFLAAMLNTELFNGGGIAGKSMRVTDNASYPLIFGSSFRLHGGFIAAILACIFVWWLLKRSTFGFEVRAAGANPAAAKTAGVNVKRTIILTMVVSGALAGLAATGPALGTERALSAGIVGSIGFDAITVALLGKSKPIGVFFAGVLFGALNAGGALMQASAGIPADIVQVTQAIVVLMIAGSEAVRYMRQRKREALVTTQKVEEKPVPAPEEVGA